MTTLRIPPDLQIKQILSFLRSDLETAGTRVFLSGVDEAIRRHEFDDEPPTPRSSPPAVVKQPKGFPKAVSVAIGSALLGGVFRAWCLDGQSGCDGGLCAICYLVGMVFGAIAALALLLWAAGHFFRWLSARLDAPKKLKPRATFPPTPTERVTAVRELLKGADVAEVATAWSVSEASVRAWWEVGLDGGCQALKQLRKDDALR